MAPARPSYYNSSSYRSPRSGYSSTGSRHATYSPDDWSTGRSNYPIPLTKPWMMPNH